MVSLQVTKNVFASLELKSYWIFGLHEVESVWLTISMETLDVDEDKEENQSSLMYFQWVSRMAPRPKLYNHINSCARKDCELETVLLRTLGINTTSFFKYLHTGAFWGPCWSSPWRKEPWRH